jgi:hypothetical protein
MHQSQILNSFNLDQCPLSSLQWIIMLAGTPQPSNLNSQPSTLNPQPSTLNPQPMSADDHSRQPKRQRIHL